MGKTKIEWVTHSWSPVTGCTKISEGCRSCWAKRMARRLAGRYGYPEMPNHFDVTLHPDRLFQPLHWRKSRSVFVCSMSDLFHEGVEILDSTYIRDIFAIMALSHRHTFMLLTKRPHIAEHTLTDKFADSVEWATWELKQMDGMYDERWHASEFEWPLPNVWGMVTVESQDYVWRVEELLKCPFVVRGVSVEPLLGPVDLRWYLEGQTPWCGPDESDWYYDPDRPAEKLDLVIAGGESGPGARPMRPDWARNLRDQCQAASIPYFYKQHGAWLHESQFTDGQLLAQILKTEFNLKNANKLHKWPDGSISYRVGKKAAGRLLDGKEWNEFPQERTRHVRS